MVRDRRRGHPGGSDAGRRGEDGEKDDETNPPRLREKSLEIAAVPEEHPRTDDDDEQAESADVEQVLDGDMLHVMEGREDDPEPP